MSVEIPNKIDSHFDIIIPGIESEEVEEINDAYKDILEELGKNLVFLYSPSTLKPITVLQQRSI